MTDEARSADYPIDPIYLQRWSPRAFTGEPIEPEVLLQMFEAARWAPSSYNSQPWRFAYALRGTDAWTSFLQLLTPNNASWARDAAALVLLISQTYIVSAGSDEEKPSYSHSLDAGAAAGYFALEATRLGWHVHGMVGFDKERAFDDLGVPLRHRVEAMFAVGRRGDPAMLPEALRAREKPSGRRPVGETVFQGRFPG